MSIKLIDPVSFPPHLEDLQFPPGVLDEIRATLKRDPGLVLVSAPPFSGGSSTTYSLVVELLSQERSLALIESPRSARLAATVQVEFFPEIRNGFIEALSRPEVMESEVIAVTATHGVDWSAQPAGLTGSRQMVVRAETLSLPSALVQLVESGYPLQDVASRPALVLHQRLVRKVCSTCRVRVSSAADFVAQLGVQPQDAARLSVWRGRGCDDCRPTTGFRGRLPLVQAMVLPPWVIDALREPDLEAVRAACTEAGLVPLRKQAIAAVDAGLTTPEEIAKRQLG
jgi:type II secretory ATPase GspE/PulE/Tfp pilus assembly ATPase PilB-like protein